MVTIASNPEGISGAGEENQQLMLQENPPTSEDESVNLEFNFGENNPDISWQEQDIIQNT